jgi:hypothetical protein
MQAALGQVQGEPVDQPGQLPVGQPPFPVHDGEAFAVSGR